MVLGHFHTVGNQFAKLLPSATRRVNVAYGRLSTSMEREACQPAVIHWDEPDTDDTDVCQFSEHVFLSVQHSAEPTARSPGCLPQFGRLLASSPFSQSYLKGLESQAWEELTRS